MRANRDQSGHERLDGRAHVIRTLRRLGPLSQADLARHAILAPSTVSGIVAGLRAEGLIAEVDRASGPVAGGSRGGRPGTLLVLQQSIGVVIGIDFGKQHVRVAVADLAHNILTEKMHPLVADRPAAEHISCAASLFDDALSELGMETSQVVGVAMGIPGPVRRTSGLLGDTTILPGWVGVDPLSAVSRALNVPVQVDNDANLGALSEWMWGAARGSTDVAYLKVSTGIGGGLIIGGQPFAGAGGTAGEIGHVVIDPQGPVCRCGNRGCLETLAGGAALLRALQPARGSGLTISDIVGLAQGGDAECGRVLAESGHALGIALAALCNLINPELVVVGGELATAGELLLDPLRQSLRQAALRSAVYDVEVVQGRLGERAEMLGAVALALRSSALTTA